MDNKPLSKITMRHLQCFIAVADCKNYTKAAEVVGITQEAVSSNIPVLEKWLGTRDKPAYLFDPRFGPSTLTEFGEAFLPIARRIYRDMQQARTLPQRQAAGEVGTLRFGFTGSALCSGKMVKLLNEFRKAFPNVTIEMHEYSTEAQTTRLKNDEIDIGFMRSPKNDPELGYSQMEREALIAVLPPRHRLASQKQNTIHISELKNDKWVLISEQDSPGYHAEIVDLCRAGGFDPNPRVQQYATANLTVVGLVAAGVGVTVVSSGVRNIQLNGLTYINLTPVRYAWMTLGWLIPKEQEMLSPIIRNFLKLAGVPTHVIENSPNPDDTAFATKLQD